jgi:hypothetical protein
MTGSLLRGSEPRAASRARPTPLRRRAGRPCSRPTVSLQRRMRRCRCRRKSLTVPVFMNGSADVRPNGRSCTRGGAALVLRGVDEAWRTAFFVPAALTDGMVVWRAGEQQGPNSLAAERARSSTDHGVEMPVPMMASSWAREGIRDHSCQDTHARPSHGLPAGVLTGTRQHTRVVEGHTR